MKSTKIGKDYTERRTMPTELIVAIQEALNKGYRVELIKGKNGEIQANTVSRKLLK